MCTARTRFAVASPIHLQTECGDRGHAPDLDDLVAAARDSDDLQQITWATWAASPFLLAQEERERAEQLLVELGKIAVVCSESMKVERPSRTRRYRPCTRPRRPRRAARRWHRAAFPYHQRCLATSRAQLA